MDKMVPTFQELPAKRVAEPPCSHPGQSWPRDLLLQGLRAERGLLSLSHSHLCSPRPRVLGRAESTLTSSSACLAQSGNSFPISLWTLHKPGTPAALISETEQHTAAPHLEPNAFLGPVPARGLPEGPAPSCHMVQTVLCPTAGSEKTQRARTPGEPQPALLRVGQPCRQLSEPGPRAMGRGCQRRQRAEDFLTVHRPGQDALAVRRMACATTLLGPAGPACVFSWLWELGRGVT